MFPGRTAAELFGVEVPAPRAPEPEPAAGLAPDLCLPAQTADVAAVFSSRAAFSSVYPAATLFDTAKKISAAGLLPNVICQSYPDHQVKRLLERAPGSAASSWTRTARRSEPAKQRRDTPTALL